RPGDRPRRARRDRVRGDRRIEPSLECRGLEERLPLPPDLRPGSPGDPGRSHRPSPLQATSACAVMRRRLARVRRALTPLSLFLAGVFLPCDQLRAQLEPTTVIEPLFNWDIISLEQNNPRFNASVLTGFHSVRSPGVTPYRGWKVGLGVYYTREEQVSNVNGVSLFDRDQVLLNPKLNYGFFPSLEAGIGLTGGYAQGRELVTGADGMTVDEREDNLGLNSADIGVKWKFWDEQRFRFALSFDSRIAIDRDEFGNIPGTLFNIELDGDFAVTGRFSMVANLQFLTSASALIEDQVMGDIGRS